MFHKTRRKVIFRTRANHQQGMGDLLGCLAMAQEFLSRGAEIMMLAEPDPEAIECLNLAGLKHLYAQNNSNDVKIIKAVSPDCLVVNMLQSDQKYLQSLKSYAGILVTVDDDGPGAGVADLCINALYPVPGALVEPCFVPLREDFQKYHHRKKNWKKEITSILVTLGGADTYGFTPLVIRALNHLPYHVSIDVILGPAFKHQTELNKALKQMREKYCQLFLNVDDMARRMFQADIAVCGGGITLFEMACVGTPVVVVCSERFEVATATRFTQMGFGINLGFGKECSEDDIRRAANHLSKDRNLRASMGKRGRELVDGQGARKSVDAIVEKWNHLFREQFSMR